MKRRLIVKRAKVKLYFATVFPDEVIVPGYVLKQGCYRLACVHRDYVMDNARNLIQQKTWAVSTTRFGLRFLGGFRTCGAAISAAMEFINLRRRIEKRYGLTGPTDD